LLAEVETASGAKDLLDKASAMQHYAERLKAGIEVERPIALGVLKIKAKLGELCPATPPSEKGRGKKKGKPALPFSKPAIADYRKLAANREKLDEYYGSMDDVPSQAGFLKELRDKQRAAKDRQRAKARKAATKAIGKAKTIEEALSAAKFSAICIDPPWDWKDEGDNSQLGRGNTTYGSMSHEELLAFPVGQYGAADSHIYLWITNRSLPKGFSLLEAWGYRYVTMLTWCKPSIGMGNYFRGSTEQVLFGVRGSLSLSRKDAGTWFSAPRGKAHSAKPDSFYDLVESCSPGPYLDVFARRERDGWVCWGGEL